MQGFESLRTVGAISGSELGLLGEHRGQTVKNGDIRQRDVYMSRKWLRWVLAVPLLLCFACIVVADSGPAP